MNGERGGRRRGREGKVESKKGLLTHAKEPRKHTVEVELVRGRYKP